MPASPTSPTLPAVALDPATTGPLPAITDGRHHITRHTPDRYRWSTMGALPEVVRAIRAVRVARGEDLS